MWRAVKYETATRIAGKPADIPIGDRSRLVLYKGETNAPHAVMHNPPNWPDMLIWKNMLKPGDLFIDVGANIGVYSVYAAEQGAEVIAVEPNTRNAGRVREHLQLNGYDGQVVQKALSDKPGVVHITENLDSLNHLVDSGGVEVEATTLDDIVGSRTAGVKIDVEGAEALVLAGARVALAERRLDPIQLEWAVDPHMVDTDRSPVLAILNEYGYRLYTANRDGTLSLVDGTPSALNVFARPS